MGRINLNRLLGEQFNLYVPILMLLICIMTLFRIAPRLFRLFGFDNIFIMVMVDDVKDSDPKFQEGRKLIEQGESVK